MIWLGGETNLSIIERECRWHKWFAWYPVVFSTEKDGEKTRVKKIWLETVMRRSAPAGQGWYYRVIKKKSGRDVLLMKCPNCKNGRIYPAFPHKGFPASGLPCDICDGMGELPDDIDYIPDEGKLLKGSRYRSGRTLKEEALRLNIDANELSRMERGYFRKNER